LALACVFLILDFSESFWITRSRLGRGRFSRFGRSDTSIEDDADSLEDYDDTELLDALADAIMDRQEKRSVASLVRNRDLRTMMNPMARNKGLGK